jgi:hypothetical protein
METTTFILNNLEAKINYTKEIEICTAGKDNTQAEKINSILFLLDKSNFWASKFKSDKEKKETAKQLLNDVEKKGRALFETVKYKYSITKFTTVINHPEQLQLL